MISFENDYIQGAHPEILGRLAETNLEPLSGYGSDSYCESARRKIRKACGCENAEVHFLVGGTQTNAVVIDAMLKGLSPREREVIVLRFGLESGRPMTLEEVGKRFNVTRERIRQIETAALRKLRNPTRSKKIKDFLP